MGNDASSAWRKVQWVPNSVGKKTAPSLCQQYLAGWKRHKRLLLLLFCVDCSFRASLMLKKKKVSGNGVDVVTSRASRVRRPAPRRCLRCLLQGLRCYWFPQVSYASNYESYNCAEYPPPYLFRLTWCSNQVKVRLKCSSTC